MTTTKKVLSIILCLSMLLGVITIGSVSVFAADNNTDSAVPSYSELQDKYPSGNFLYMGVDLMEDGDVSGKFDVESDNVLIKGRKVQANVYLKSDLDVYSGVYYLVYDSNVFGYVDGSVKSETGITVSKLTASQKATFIRNLGTGTYTTAEIRNQWEILAVNDTANVTEKRNTSSDDPFFTITLNVKENDNDTSYTSARKIFLIPETFGENAYGSYIYIGGTEPSNKNAAVDNLEIAEPLEVSFEYVATFMNGDTQVASFVYGVGKIISAPAVDNLYGWVKDDTTELVNFRKERMPEENVTFFAVLKDEEVEVVFDAGTGTINGESTITETVTISEGINLDNYVPVNYDGTEFTGWTIDNVVYSGQYEITSLSVTFVAKWGEGSDLSIMIPDAVNGGWIEYATYSKGTTGSNATIAQINEIKAMLTDDSGNLTDEVCDLIGAEEKFGAKPVFSNLLTEDPNGSSTLYNAYTSKTVDGVQISHFVIFGTSHFIYLDAKIEYVLNVYAAELDEAGNKTGEWTDVSTTNYIYSSANVDGKFMRGNDEVTDVISFKVTSVNFEYDSNAYTLSYKDGNEKVLTPDAQSNITFNKVNTTAGKEGEYDLYIDLQAKEYRVGFNAGNNTLILSTATFAFGDTVNMDSYLTLYTSPNATSTYSLYTLQADGAKANKSGFKLTDIYYTDATTSERVSILNGGEFVIDDAITGSSLMRNVSVNNKSVPAVILSSDWEADTYLFTVVYKTKSGDWQKLTEKNFSGSDVVSYASLIDSDLQAVIDENLAEGESQIYGEFITEDGSSIKDVRAYQGPMTLKISYSYGGRYVFMDYNNDSSVNNVGYDRQSVNYGDIIYDPDYTPDSEGNKPVVNSMIDGFKPASKPDKIVTGYEYKTKPKLDGDGNPIINELTGEPETEYDLDDDGNKVEDKDKPIYKDPKGEESRRPYRNCEYAGYKVYHLDKAYSNYTDIPSQDEWIEGFESSDYRTYNTTIVLIIWKPDTDYRFRVYDTDGNIYSALGKDGKWYYWSNNIPCTRKEATLNTNKENMFILMFNKTVETAELADGETAESKYYSAFSIGKTLLSPGFIPSLIPTIVTLIKGLIAG